jgi:hypothetical protein
MSLSGVGVPGDDEENDYYREHAEVLLSGIQLYGFLKISILLSKNQLYFYCKNPPLDDVCGGGSGRPALAARIFIRLEE